LSYRDVDTILDKLKAVTAEQVRDVAKKYLKDEVLTVAVLDPQPLEQKAPSVPSPALRH
jgi:zinc protease